MSEEKCKHYEIQDRSCTDDGVSYYYCGDIDDCYYKQLKTAKEKIELYKSFAGDVNEGLYIENEQLTQQHKQLEEQRQNDLVELKKATDACEERVNAIMQQSKQMRESINNIKNLCNEDWEDMTVDKFQNQLLQALKGVE